MNLLIVDDDPDITEFYKTALEGEGLKIDTYNDPREALTNFKPDYYDIALIDVRMPEMNGFDLYKEMKKSDPCMKVCFVTAFEVNYKALQEILPDMTKESYISKPIALADLNKHIHYLLQESHQP
ncbi:MAG TPA: response regulator [Nitrososphaeraceae archaeon]|jgi:DNA-binding response OmpR family regulator|nr:response regulator [Nitrososphaeraceae archaeon]